MIVVAVVENDDSILDAAQMVIESNGWEARTYASGEAFLEDYARRSDCDCVLLDPHLPGKSGIDVARAVAHAHVPIVVLTARPDSALTRAVVELGARAVATKPVSAGGLLQIIGALLPAAG